MTQTASRAWRALAITVALFLSLTIGLSLNPARDSAAGSGGGEANEVEVTLTEFAVEPADLTLPARTPLTVRVTNAGVAPHDYTIEGVGGTDTLGPGDTATLEVGPLEVGSYPVLCTVPGHASAGMTGTLTVTDDGGASLHGVGTPRPGTATRP